jgi:hypothetical protein
MVSTSALDRFDIAIWMVLDGLLADWCCCELPVCWTIFQRGGRGVGRICMLEGTVSAFELLAICVSEANDERLGLTHRPTLTISDSLGEGGTAKKVTSRAPTYLWIHYWQNLFTNFASRLFTVLLHASHTELS